MATNNDGHLLATDGNVAIDFVWGNMPMQPNDDRPNTATGRLDPALDNHIIALSGWGGYPQFTADSAGEDVAGSTDYILTPNVLGLTTALAQDALKDASFGTITVNSAATNAAKSITDIDRTVDTYVVRLTITGGVAAYPIGTKITVASTGTVDGTWTVSDHASTDKVYFVSTATTALSTGTGSVIGVPGTIKAQSIAAAQNNIVPGSVITITPWAAAS